MVRLVLIALLVGFTLSSSANGCVKNQIEVKSFPNPFTNQVTIQLSENSENIEVEIRDILGKVVYTNHYDGSRKSISLKTENLKKGIYILNVLAGNETASQRIIRE